MKMKTWLILLIAVWTEGFLFQEKSAVTPENPFVFVGENLTLTCEDMKQGGNGIITAGYLYFKRNSTQISKKYTRAMSGRSIQLTYPILSAEDEVSYTCYMNHTLLGQQRVTVEYRPKQLTRQDVHVLVDDWRTMRVSWDVGNNWIHPDLVKSDLTWRIKDRYQPCPAGVNNNNNITDACLWREHDGRNSFKNVPYFINIVIMVFNKSGIEMSRSEANEFFIDTKLYVKPAAVVNLTAYKVSSTSICLSWQLTSSSSIREVQCNVNFNARHQLPIKKTTSELQVCFDALRPFTEYDVNVSTVPLINGTPKGHHSDAIQFTVTTEQDVPSEAPAVVSGCFHFWPCRYDGQCSLTIYWQAVPEETSNGKITTYNINVTHIGGTVQKSYNSSGSQRSLVLHVGRRQGYFVALSASTEAGPSQKYTTMIIPDFTRKPAYPVPVLVEEEGRRVFISWTAPLKVEVISYTLFYCNTSKIAHSCLPDEDIQWIELPANKTDHDIEVHNPEDILTGMSVRVNETSGPMSSGIAWSNCTFSRNKKPQQPKNVLFSELQPDFALKIEWDRPGCRAGEPYIIYYVLEYCRGAISTCTGPILKENISNYKTKHTIKDLEVGVSYRVMLKAASRGGVGPSSDPLVASVRYSGLSSAHIAGIAIAAAFFITFVLAGIVFFGRRIHRGIQTFKVPIDVPGIDHEDTLVPPIHQQSYPSHIEENKVGSSKKMMKVFRVGKEEGGEKLEENVSPGNSRNTSTSESVLTENSQTLLIALQGKAGAVAKEPITSSTHSHSSSIPDEALNGNKFDHGTINHKGKDDSSTVLTTATKTEVKAFSDKDLRTNMKKESQSVSDKGSDNFGYSSMEDLETLDSNSAASYSRVGRCSCEDFSNKKTAAVLHDTNFDYVKAPF